MGMKIRPLTEIYAVSPQIRPADVALAAARGYKTIINNRPDGENWGQPKGTDIEAETKIHGLAYHHIAIRHSGLQSGQIEELTQVQATAPGPILAYCHAGARAATVWALSQAGKMEAETIINAAASAGYDINNLRPYLG